MPRLRPVHNLTHRESALALAIAAERRGETVAERLKAKIEAYWRERGFDVRVTLQGAEIRTDTINGLPTGGKHERITVDARAGCGAGGGDQSGRAAVSDRADAGDGAAGGNAKRRH